MARLQAQLAQNVSRPVCSFYVDVSFDSGTTWARASAPADNMSDGPRFRTPSGGQDDFEWDHTLSHLTQPSSRISQRNAEICVPVFFNVYARSCCGGASHRLPSNTLLSAMI